MKSVVYFGSREIYGDFRTAVNSLLKHTEVDKVFAVVEDDKLPFDLPVEVIRWENKWFNGLNTKTKWKSFGCIRPALTKLFPDLDTILSLDLDTIVEKDISELFKIDLDGKYFAAVREPGLSIKTPYYNTGVCLMNLKLLRESGKDDEMINALNTIRFQYVSQDCMNFFCDRVLDLPSDYNACKFTVRTDNVKIRHFADEPHWRERWNK